MMWRLMSHDAMCILHRMQMVQEGREGVLFTS